MIAKGVSEMAKVRRIEKKGIAHPFERPTFIGNQPNQALPPVQTEYIRPQGSIYETGDLVVQPSVTENTTRHLEINTEGETMTLPKK